MGANIVFFTNKFAKNTILLSSIYTTRKVWGHKSYDTAKAVRYVQYKRFKKHSLKNKYLN